MAEVEPILSYYDYLLRAVAQGDKKSIGQWNTLIRQALKELDNIMESETVYDSTMMFSFQDYQRQLARIAREKLGIEVATPPQLPRIRFNTRRRGAGKSTDT